ncbi:peptidoglycan-binding domain-containing protein [Streptacidiphilus rugosus]|uniref:peptidoglycan-binding domain-containing protein n=1 Tax=Streptacidiphilus rugosus TaxID=405783 RepID=UPI000559FA75|nr:peptidoglycan-binding domain-containing protein [Streptacidiphilus rugosus]
MGFPPRDGSDDDTTVLPPIDGDPSLVRPYVHAADDDFGTPPHGGPALHLPVPLPDPMLPTPVAPTETSPVRRVGATTPVPAPRTPAHDVEATSLLPMPLPATAPLPVPVGGPAAGPRGGGRAEARRAAQRRSKTAALAGGAIALAAAGTVIALLTQSNSGSPVASAQPTDPGVAAPVAPDTAAPSTQPAPSKTTASHSAKPSATRPSTHPSASAARHTAPVAPTSQAPSSPSPSSSATDNGGNGTDDGTLQTGSTGPAVVTLQHELRSLWIDRGLHATGVYDDQTAADVATFQIWYDVQGDPPGVFGPNSQAKMADLMSGNGGRQGGGNG